MSKAIDLNTATEDELHSIHGIGPVLSRRIVDYRSRQDGFRAVEQLQMISGIDATRYRRLQDNVVVLPPEGRAVTQFDPNWFRQQSFKPENGLLDRKSELYTVYGDEDSKAEFVKDMIALANTARRRGRPAYLLFGVVDKPSESSDPFPGIGGQCSHASKPKDWHRLNLEGQQNETIGTAYQRVIRQHVFPDLEFEYVYGYMDKELVSYIVIFRNNSKHPFEIKKRVGERKPGDCWRRIGESNNEVEPEEKQYLYRYSEVPYIFKESWIDHFSESLQVYDVHLDSRIRLSLSGNSELTQYADDELPERLTFEELPPVTLVTGPPGAGKTTLLQGMVHELSANALTELQGSSTEGELIEPIPIYVDLNSRQSPDVDDFRSKIVAGLDRFSRLDLLDHPKQFDFLQRSEHRFVVFLDGLDEVSSANASQTVCAIRAVIDYNVSRLKFIIAGRKKGIKASWLSRYPILEIEPVGRVQASVFLQATLDRAEEAMQLLRRDPDLLALVSSPLALQTFRDVWQIWEAEQKEYERRLIESNEEDGFPAPLDPSVAQVIEEIVERIVRRDVHKGTIDEMYEHLSVLGKLALRLKVRNQRAVTLVTAKDQLGEEAYAYFLKLGLLTKERGKVSFSSPLLLDYFSVYSLRELIEQSAGTPELSWQRCGQMLQALISDLLPPLLHSYARSQIEKA
jgi:GTPase SAR1 family protein